MGDDVAAQGMHGVELVKDFCRIFGQDYNKVMRDIERAAAQHTDIGETAKAAFVAGVLFTLHNQIGGKVTDKHARQR